MGLGGLGGRKVCIILFAFYLYLLSSPSLEFFVIFIGLARLFVGATKEGRRRGRGKNSDVNVMVEGLRMIPMLYCCTCCCCYHQCGVR